MTKATCLRAVVALPFTHPFSRIALNVDRIFGDSPAPTGAQHCIGRGTACGRLMSSI